jgi:ABC-type sugar transport system substrate-binding protein
LIPFTEEIAQGAKDAGADLGADVEVVGPPAFSAPQEIAFFNGFMQKGDDGIVIVPNPPEAYPVVIKKAVKAGIAVETANVISPKAGVGWFGQDEYNSGILLANTLLKTPAMKGAKGTVVVGSCAPGVSVLTERYNGVMKVLGKYKGLHVIGPFNVTGNPATNYSAWQSLYTAHTDAVAMIGLCALDNPDLAQLKRKYHATFAAGGYDLQLDTLQGVKAGLVDVTVGQNPYLQGYLPVKAIVDHLEHGKPLVKGWVNTGTEIVTKSNVDFYIAREKSPAKTHAFYMAQIKAKYANLNALEQPYPKGS